MDALAGTCELSPAPVTDFYFWAALFAVTVLTSIISGILGMAGGLLLLIALLVRLEPLVAIPIHGVVQLVSNGSRAIFLRQYVQWRAVLRFAWPLLPAGALGVWFARSIPPAVGQIGIGVFVLLSSWAPSALAFGGRLFVRQKAGNQSASTSAERALPWGGALVGFFSTVVGATGPLLGPFILALGLGSEGTVATLAACQIFQHGTKVALFGLTGFPIARYLLPTLALCAAAVLGSALGTRLLNRVPQRTFHRVVRVVLSVLALELVVEGGLRLLGYI
jgi:uncharacterized membrane protein YfcA